LISHRVSLTGAETAALELHIFRGKLAKISRWTCVVFGSRAQLWLHEMWIDESDLLIRAAMLGH
jgi:hypothetical protein